MSLDSKLVNLSNSICIDGVCVSLLETIRKYYGLTFKSMTTHSGLPLYIYRVGKAHSTCLVLFIDESGGLICEYMGYDNVFLVVNWFKDGNLHGRKVSIVSSKGNIIGEGELLRVNSKCYVVRVGKHIDISEYETYYVSQATITTINSKIVGKAVSTRIPLYITLNLLQEDNLNIEYLILLAKSKTVPYNTSMIVKELKHLKELSNIKTLIIVKPTTTTLQIRTEKLYVNSVKVKVLHYPCKNGYYCEEVELSVVDKLLKQLQVETRNT